MQPNSPALRKRTQISKANRMMLLWIAGASAIIGCALVVAFFLGQKLVYNEKVLAAKNNTISVLQANNAVVPDLETQVRALDASAVLASAKAKEEDQTLQVILDALPSDANSLALGASLQQKLLAGIPGLRIESLQVDPVVGIESLSQDSSSEDAAGLDSNNEITFQFSVVGNQTALKKVLTNLERSIRAIDILSLRIESQSPTQQLMTVQARAFYEPARTLQLYDKAVKQ
jgi:hypothetical protein